MKSKKAKSEPTWVSLGNGLGRFRGESLARSPETVRQTATELGQLLKERMAPSSGFNAHMALWYAIKGAQTVLKQAEEEMLDDLWHLDAFTPEVFEVNKLTPPKKKKGRK